MPQTGEIHLFVASGSLTQVNYASSLILCTALKGTSLDLSQLCFFPHTMHRIDLLFEDGSVNHHEQGKSKHNDADPVYTMHQP